MAERGWGIRISTDQWKHTLFTGPAIAEDVMVLGWWTSWGRAPDEPLNPKTLSVRDYGSVPISIRAAAKSDVDDAARGVPRLAPSLAAARHCYTIWTTAGRSELDYALQVALWHALGEVTSGVMQYDSEGCVRCYALDIRIGDVPDVPAPAARRMPNVEIGKPAPAVRLKAQDGSVLDLCAQLGKRVALWFIPCELSKAEAELAQLAKHQEIIKRKVDLIVIANDTPESVQRVTARLGLQFPVLADVPLRRDGSRSASSTKSAATGATSSSITPGSCATRTTAASPLSSSSISSSERARRSAHDRSPRALLFRFVLIISLEHHL